MPVARANEWGPGWCVVVGTPGACPNDGTELRDFQCAGRNTLDGTGALDGVGNAGFQFARFAACRRPLPALSICVIRMSTLAADIDQRDRPCFEPTTSRG